MVSPQPTGNRPDTKDPMQNPHLKAVTSYGRITENHEGDLTYVKYYFNLGPGQERTNVREALRNALVANAAFPKDDNDFGGNERETVFTFKSADAKFIEPAVRNIDAAVQALKAKASGQAL